MAEKFLNATQLAEALGISRETLRQMVLAGTITGYRAHPKARPVYLLSESHAAVKARPCSHSDTARRFAEAAMLREFAAVVDAVNDALADGRMTSREAAKIRRKGEAMIAATYGVILAAEKQTTTIPMRPATLADAS